MDQRIATEAAGAMFLAIALLSLGACTTRDKAVKVEPYDQAVWYGCPANYRLYISGAAAGCTTGGSKSVPVSCPTFERNGKHIAYRLVLDPPPRTINEYANLDRCVGVGSDGRTSETTPAYCPHGFRRSIRKGRDECWKSWSRTIAPVRGASSKSRTGNWSGVYYSCPSGFLFRVAVDRRSVKCVSPANRTGLEYEPRNCSRFQAQAGRKWADNPMLHYVVDDYLDLDYCSGRKLFAIQKSWPAFKPVRRTGYQLHVQPGQDVCVKKDFTPRFQTSPTVRTGLR